MANQISPQVDIGGLTLRGLSAFTPLLASLSIDNVVPTAVLQMENLGGRFLISGEYAAKVPDYLQRCSSVRLERLALTVGWRKGDTASLMASSAGGQALALLSLCLLTLYGSNDAGTIFLNLSKKLLPSTVAISSMRQLVAVGDLLKDKLETLGFGNLLAKQVTKVHGAYENMGLAVPRDFLEPMSPESMTELLESVSRALQDETKIVRITGTYAQGHILGLVLMMFPQDTLVTVNGFVLFEGTRKSIVVEFEASGQRTAITQFQLETLLSTSAELSLPIKIEPVDIDWMRPRWSFAWNNWVADLLQLEFLYVGLTCPRDLLTSICDLLVRLPELVRAKEGRYPHENELPPTGLLKSLGPNHYQRMYECCQVVYGSSPSGLQSDIPTAYSKFAAVAMESLKLVDCSCSDQPRCDPAHGWCIDTPMELLEDCRRVRLWNAIGTSLNYAFWCLFMNVGTNISMSRPSLYFPTSILSTINCALHSKDENHYFFCTSFHFNMMRMFSLSDGTIGVSSGANVIFPVALRDVSLASGLPILYEVLEGKFLLDGRYHMTLRDSMVTPRKRAETNILSRKDEIRPTSSGEHESLTMTIRECLDSLELRSTIRVSGQNVSVELGSIITASYGLVETEPCDHPVDTPLDPNSTNFITTTSVASPATSENTLGLEKRTSIAQTKHNPTAQLLCCERGVRSVLLKECCLDCALSRIRKGSKGGRMTMIIV